MPLGREVGLGTDGDPAPITKRAQQPPHFGRCLLWPNGCPFQRLLSSFLWSPYGIGQTIIFSSCGFFYFFTSMPSIPASSIQPFGRNKHGPKIWGSASPFGEADRSPHNTKSPGPRPSSIPSDILIHAAIWPQQIWAKNRGLCPFGGGGAGSPSNALWRGPRPTCIPSGILIHETIWPQNTRVTDRLQTTERQMAIAERCIALQPSAKKRVDGIISHNNIA